MRMWLLIGVHVDVVAMSALVTLIFSVSDSSDSGAVSFFDY